MQNSTTGKGRRSRMIMRLMFVAAVLMLAQTASADATKRGRAFEDQLLRTVSPIFFPGGGERHAPPLPIEWYVQNCELVGFKSDLDLLKPAVENGREQLSMQEVVERSAGDPHRWYRLTFRDHTQRRGREIDWARDTRIYGRVVEAGPGDEYHVQYFLLFAWNDTDTPASRGTRNEMGMGWPSRVRNPDNAGNHEGDWVCVEFTVRASDPKKPAFLRGVYHNHGRQIFVDYGKSGFLGRGNKPFVFLERGTNEPWPFPSNEGIKDDDRRIPPGVSASKRFGAIENDSTAPGGYSLVRTHAEDRLEREVATVVNVGSEKYGKKGDEVWFFHHFPGRYGSIWYKNLYGPKELDTPSPRGPVFQPQMWKREHGKPVWVKE
jgi:hypothetical protein